MPRREPLYFFNRPQDPHPMSEPDLELFQRPGKPHVPVSEDVAQATGHIVVQTVEAAPTPIEVHVS